MCVCVCVRVRKVDVRDVWRRFAGLTDDDGAHLLPASAQLVLGLADEGGVDGVVHLLHHQLVVHHHHRVGQKAGRPGGGRMYEV